ncbi:3-oxoacyl-[acyl-carrier-protein] synthase III C-terminal domain-containing protein [Streptomyces hokutonensis]|uniref:3-oxoacyl-[acyl-carrier-protein] synthase III C-terminal domain-containing protein n=1 Tax=Streptomyces hokutonensis TaxID=1306990 RepID=UPI0033F0499D
MLRYGRAFGLDKICWDDTRSEKEILLAAVDKLSLLRGQEDRVRYLIRPRSQRSPSPYPVSVLHEVRRETGLRHARTFAVTEHACAAGLFAIDMAGMLLAEEDDPEAMALVLVGEKAFSPVTQHLSGICVTGEATSAVLVSARGTRDRILGFAITTVSVGESSMVMTDDGAARFRDLYGDALTETVNAALADADVGIADIALVLPHNVNRVAWVRMAEQLGVPVHRIFLDNVPQTGHCYGADPFLNYATACELGRLSPGDRYLMISVGLGASFTALVVEH